MPIPEGRLRGVVFAALGRDFGGQWRGLTQAVAWVAIERGWYPPPWGTRIIDIDPADEPRLREYVGRLMTAGLMQLGTNEQNARWPWLSLTAKGRALVRSGDDACMPSARQAEAP